MKKIEALVPAFKADEVRQALEPYKLRRLTLVEARGGGSDQTETREYRGVQYAQDAYEIKLELIVDDDEAEAVADAIVAALRTGALCDGEVWVLPMEKVFRVRVGKQISRAAQAEPAARRKVSLKSLGMRFRNCRIPT
jgi:nitrogen regulatory protein P-II 1